MHISFTGHNVDVSDHLKEFTTSKLDKLERHSDKITSIQITFATEKLQHVTEGTVHVKGNELHASSSHENVFSSVEALIDKLDRQVLKHKDKHSHQRGKIDISDSDT